MHFEANAFERPDSEAHDHEHDDHLGEKLLRDVLDRALDKYAEGEQWTITPSEFWCYQYPPGYLNRFQGWKIHVSATPVSASEVLERASGVLVRHRCAFKFAKGLRQLEEMVSSRADRGSGGKFITAYPKDDEAFRAVIVDLHEATDGLAGPGILSDKAYQPGSLVHYRYGGFSPIQVLNTEGSYEHMLIAPDGSYASDSRKAWFSSPEWAPRPLDDTPPSKPDSARSKPVLLDDRFVVREAIRHSFRGGVYRAEDTRTGEPVVIKQARPHTGADPTGNDSWDWMRHEAEMLDELEPLGFTPKKVRLFEYQGDLFLAEEQFDGKSLRHWCEARVAETGEELALPEAERVARELVRMMAAVHERGLVLRDFNPGNIVVPSDGSPRLIDLEFLARQGEQVRNVATQGYVAPENLDAKRHDVAPAPSADVYSLGATLLYLTTRIDPTFPADDEDGRPYAERLADFVRATVHTGESIHAFAPLIIGLTAKDPDRRWTLRQATEFLDSPARQRPRFDREAATRLDIPQQQRLLDDGLAHTVAVMAPESEHLWPPIMAEGRTSDPCNVQSGAGGILGVLVRACQHSEDEELWDGMRRTAYWVDRALPKEPRVLPGLYFGRSGTAWALHEAALLLADTELAERAMRLAKRVPTRWFNPDMTHGTAGAGTAMLYFLRATGDPEFGERAHACARSLIASVERNRDQVAWPVQEEFSSQMAGIRHHGFAHGVAGVSNFLLTAGQQLDTQEYLDLAVAGGESLCRSVIRENDKALWPTGEDGQEDVGLTWWCSGSAGVGTFLIRLWRDTGERRYRELSEAAAVAVRKQRWLLSPSACHGGAGAAEFLLDLAALLGADRYREWAEEIAMSIHARSALRAGRLVAPGDSMSSVEMGYNTGLAGVLGFLLRLRYGGTRLWMAEDLELRAAP